MRTAEPGTSVFQRLDELNEFERQPVAEDKLCGGGYFAANFVGEHVAATEFVIGALFVKFGASAYDVLVGLLLGNLLAVLSWGLVCAPIAVQTRLTLYWYLRKIAGPPVTVVYNVLNAVMYCILAGAMITVSASAVRIPFGIPDQTGWMPTDFRFVLVVLGVGAVVVALAIMGFKRLAQFASLCAPWMILMFPAGALVMLAEMGSVHGWSDYWRLANTHIWTGSTVDGSAPLGFWHVVAFAWVCNLAMHLGLSDMALFRYARRASYGFYSALGMYLGHYLAWISAGIMGAVAAMLLKRPITEIDSGTVAYQALGAMGALAVVIAGWTTSNPTLYRAGLALQVVTPGWPRWLVTLAAGAVTTLIACSPFVFTRLLDFVAIYGILLAPVGAIVVAEHWIFPRIGFTQFWSARKSQLINWPALVSWGVGLGFAAAAWFSKRLGNVEIVHEFFLVVPVWILTTGFYLVLSALAGAREKLPEIAGEAPEPSASLDPLPPEPAGPRPPAIALAAGGVAVTCLALCLILPLGVFGGYLGRMRFQGLLVWVTLLYFASALVWAALRGAKNAGPD